MPQIYYLATSERSYSKGYGVEPLRVLCGYMLVKLKKQGGRYTEWLQTALVANVSKLKPKTETSQSWEIKTQGQQSQTANLTVPVRGGFSHRPSGHLLPPFPQSSPPSPVSGQLPTTSCLMLPNSTDLCSNKTVNIFSMPCLIFFYIFTCLCIVGL